MKKKTLKKEVFEYTAIFEPEKKGYSVYIPALPGCVSQGETFEEAMEMIKEAASLYIEVLKERNEPIYEELGRAITVPIKIYA